MKRLVVLALALAGIIGVVPAAATALPPGVVPGPNSITGTVTDESGQGLSPVLVYDPTFSISTVTEADGTYLLEGVPTGTEGVVTADDLFNRFPSSESESVIVSGDGTVVADIVMHPFPTAGISGTIRDTVGGPLSGITVTESQQGRSTVTTADGVYAFDGLRIDQSVTIFASDPSGLHRSNFNDIFDIAADGSSVLDLVLIDNVPSVVGLVTDPAGNAVAGASVSIPDIGGFAQTDGTGRFAVGDATADGTFTLSVDPTAVRPDLASADVPVTLVAGSSVTANVQLARGATIDLTVTAGGAPADATVALWSGLQFGGVVQRAEVGVDGTVTLPIRADGDYYVEVTSRTTEFASEFYPDSIFREDGQRFTFAGEQHVAITVELEQAATISGTITRRHRTAADDQAALHEHLHRQRGRLLVQPLHRRSVHSCRIRVRTGARQPRSAGGEHRRDRSSHHRRRVRLVRPAARGHRPRRPMGRPGRLARHVHGVLRGH